MLSLYTDQDFVELLRQDKRYKAEAYLFVFQALSYAQEVLNLGRPSETEPPPERHDEEEVAAEEEDSEMRQHVTGQDLSRAACDFALSQYGFLAKPVLNSMGIRTTGDIGELVYNLIKIGKMSKTPEDSRDDFENVFDFSDAFDGKYEIT